jgi:hypothetical protein
MKLLEWIRGLWSRIVDWLRKDSELSEAPYRPAVRMPFWEAVPDRDNTDTEGFWRVRWSVPDDDGRYLWVGHYGYENRGMTPRLAQHMAERQAENMNHQCRCPWEFRPYQPRKAGS